MSIILDIETLALPEQEIRASLPPFDESKVALGNASKPETVARIIEEARATYGDDIVTKGALDPRYGQIAISGLKRVHAASGEAEYSQFCIDRMKEKEAIERTWKLLTYYDKARIIGFNIKGFDLPFLIRRSWRHGIPVPLSIFDPSYPRYFDKRVIDLMEVFQAGNYKEKYTGLNEVLRFLGLSQKTGKGEQFAEIWARNTSEAMLYNCADLDATHLLSEAMGL